MTDPWTGRLSEYLDGDLAAEERASLEAHLSGCPSCTRTLESLRAVMTRAARLEPAALERDLWPGIEARLGAGARSLVDLGSKRAWRERIWTFTLPQLAAAAVLLMLLTGGGVWMALRSVRPPGSAGSVASSGAPTPSQVTARGVVTADFGFSRYDAAIADLQKVLTEHRAELDTSTVRIIEQNLAVIDQATDQARRALAADPANPYLNGHLAEQMRRKVDLLRQATALVGA